MIRENIRIAIQGILSNRLRAALTMLGILIGVGAVILVVAVGNGSSKAVQSRIQALGTNTLVVSAGGFGGFGRGARNGTQSQRVGITPQDVTALQDKTNAPDIKYLSPVRTASSVTATYQGSTYSPSSFIGVLPPYSEIRNYPVQLGRFITSDDQANNSKVVVLGTTVVANLFGSATANPIGAQVQFNATTLTVVGVFKSKGSNGFQDQDDIAMIPLSTMEEPFTGEQHAVQPAGGRGDVRRRDQRPRRPRSSPPWTPTITSRPPARRSSTCSTRPRSCRPRRPTRTRSRSCSPPSPPSACWSAASG